MTAFRYRALDAEGQPAQGVLEADSARAARSLLRDRGLFPLEVDSVHAHAFRMGRPSRLGRSELTLLTRQWATLLASGLTVEKSLAALIEQAETDASRQLLAGVRSEVMSGHSLRVALDRYPGSFPPLYRASVAAGEKSGELSTLMTRLADYLDRRHSLQSKTVQALVYPAIVAIVALLVIVGLMTYVVPQVVSVFTQSQQSLPWLTRALMLISEWMRQFGLVFLAISGVLGGVGVWLLQNPVVRFRWDAWLLGWPLIGRHLRALDATRFASTLSILSSAGVPMLAALEAGRQVMVRLPLQDALRQATEAVREGQALSRALGQTRAFPPLLVHMIANGEATGRLAEQLDRAAQLSQQELENRTATLTSLLEPLLLLVMGVFVLLIVLAIMQPIIEINTLMR
jgi:general secretion pathway protein F